MIKILVLLFGLFDALVATSAENVRFVETANPANYCPQEEDFIKLESYQSKKNLCNVIQKFFVNKVPLNHFEESELCSVNPYTAYRILLFSKMAMDLEAALFKKRIASSESNAFSHCLMSGLITNAVGQPRAAQFLAAREFGKWFESVDSRAANREMDLHNNNMGIGEALKLIKADTFSNEEMIKVCLNKLNQGQLIVIAKKFKLPIKYDAEVVKKALHIFH